MVVRAIFERFSALQVEKEVKIHYFIKFYIIFPQFVSFPGPKPPPFHQEFPENPHPFTHHLKKLLLSIANHGAGISS
jgi:hypothetical protein